MDKTIKQGTEVWWFDAYSNLQNGTAQETVTQKVNGKNIPYLKITQGKHDGVSTGAKLEDCYLTKEECLEAENKRFAAQVAEYRENIQSVEDLMQFMYDHDLNSEYDYFEARAAAQESGKELLGIDLAADAGIADWNKQSVKDVKELAQFLYDSDLNSEFADYDCKELAREYAKELLDYEIKDEFTEAVNSLETSDLNMDK